MADDIQLGILVWGQMGHNDINIFVDQIVSAFGDLKGLHPFHISLGSIGDDDGIWIGAENLLGQLGDPC